MDRQHLAGDIGEEGMTFVTDELMEAIRGLAEASERVGGCKAGTYNYEEAFEDRELAWEKIEEMTGLKRP